MRDICNDISRKHSIIMYVWKFKDYVFLQFFLNEKLIEIYSCNDININKYKTNIMRCLKDHNLIKSNRRPADALKYDKLKIDDQWLVKKKECINQNGNHSCNVIICMLAWKVVSNNRFELIDDHIKGREVVIDKYLELLNQCIEVKSNESIT